MEPELSDLNDKIAKNLSTFRHTVGRFKQCLHNQVNDFNELNNSFLVLNQDYHEYRNKDSVEDLKDCLEAIEDLNKTLESYTKKYCPKSQKETPN